MGQFVKKEYKGLSSINQTVCTTQGCPGDIIVTTMGDVSQDLKGGAGGQGKTLQCDCDFRHIVGRV